MYRDSIKVTAVRLERRGWCQGSEDTRLGCAAGSDYSKWVREPVASHHLEKCRLSGPPPDLVNQNPQVNKIPQVIRRHIKVRGTLAWALGVQW